MGSLYKNNLIVIYWCNMLFFFLNGEGIMVNVEWGKSKVFFYIKLNFYWILMKMVRIGRESGFVLGIL